MENPACLIRKILFALLLLASYPACAQTMKKTVNAVPTAVTLKIDGVLDEEAWQNAAVAGEFVQRTPFNGKSATFNTEVRFLYDNSGLYIGAILFDPYPDSIPAQLGLRDTPGLNADYFAISLCPFNDGINAFAFLVYVSDVQAEFKISTGGRDDDDFSWDAVWQSKARRNSQGWVAEMKIPYSALRFPKQPVQEWGLNCQRDIRRYRETSTWNLVDSKVQGFVNQSGLLQGIREITPPLRLSVTPYLSAYMEKNPGDPDWQFSYNAGADLKYGINQSFTLDMTLIPDFGQAPSDDRIYNFSPFEIMYNEKRQFFTEGTELFNKGGIFYTRRVGDQPKNYNLPYSSLNKNEVVTENPMQSKLVNATKISGRTPGGLGIGLFNGISANTWATLQDTVTGETRRVLTQGFTNYNMIVFDQNLKNNSYIDFLNTNYFMPDEGYTANVTGTDFKFANNNYTYALSGDAFVSQKYFSHNTPEFGIRYDLAFGKIAGNFQFELKQSAENPTYDCNDMGFNAYNNFFNHDLELQYNIYEPFRKLLSWYNSATLSYNTLFSGLKFTSFTISAETFLTNINHLSMGGDLESQPVPGYDYYEPRVEGWFYETPAWAEQTAFISTDYRKKFAIDIAVAGSVASRYHLSGFSASVEPRYRISDRFFIIYSLEYEKIFNDVGYVLDSLDNSMNTVILFGRRDRQTITNLLSANLMLSGSMCINLRVRHYWVSAPYYSFYQLHRDGSLEPVTYSGNENVNFNLFNVDFNYIWNFAPGSQISFMWKNAISTFDQEVVAGYFNDLSATVRSPASNSFSIRVLYYLDALYFAKKKKRAAP